MTTIKEGRRYKCRSLTGYVEEEGAPYTLSCVLEIGDGKTIPVRIDIGIAQARLVAKGLVGFLSDNLK